MKLNINHKNLLDIINLHYKCCGNGVWRRQKASKMLHKYVSNQIESDTHSHSFSGSLSGTTGGTGSGTAIDNRPLYFALCYIIKT